MNELLEEERRLLVSAETCLVCRCKFYTRRDPSALGMPLGKNQGRLAGGAVARFDHSLLPHLLLLALLQVQSDAWQAESLLDTLVADDAILCSQPKS